MMDNVVGNNFGGRSCLKRYLMPVDGDRGNANIRCDIVL